MRPPPPQSSQNPGGGGEATSPVRAPRNPQERRRPGAETLDSGGWAQPGHSTCSLPWFSQTAEKTKLGCGEAETTVSEGRNAEGWAGLQNLCLPRLADPQHTHAHTHTHTHTTNPQHTHTHSQPPTHTHTLRPCLKLFTLPLASIHVGDGLAKVGGGAPRGCLHPLPIWRSGRGTLGLAQRKGRRPPKGGGVTCQTKAGGPPTRWKKGPARPKKPPKRG